MGASESTENSKNSGNDIIQGHSKEFTESVEKVTSIRKQTEKLQEDHETCIPQIHKNTFCENDYLACKLKNKELISRLNKAQDMLNWYKLHIKSLVEGSVALELEKQKSKIQLNEKFTSNSISAEFEFRISELKKQLDEQNSTLNKYAEKCKLLDEKCNILRNENENLRKVLNTETVELNKTRIALSKYTMNGKLLTEETDFNSDKYIEDNSKSINKACVSMTRENANLKQVLRQEQEDLQKTRITLSQSVANNIYLKHESEFLKLSITGIRKNLDMKINDIRIYDERLKNCILYNKQLIASNYDLKEELKLEIAAKESLENKFRTISESLKQSVEDYKSLDEQYKTLQISSTQLKEELSKDTLNKKLLADELKKINYEISTKYVTIAEHKKKYTSCEQDLKFYKAKSNQLEKELEDYLSNILVQRLVKTRNDLDALNKNCILARDHFVEQIKSYNRSVFISTLEEIEKDFNNHSEDLSKEQYVAKINGYKRLCAENDKKWKKIMKQVYTMPKLINNIVDKMNISVATCLFKIATATDEVKRKLNDLSNKGLTHDIDAETQMFEVIMKIAKEEMLPVKEGKTNKNNSSGNISENNVKECKILNNGKRMHSKRVKHIFSLVSKQELNSSNKSIIIYNIPENESVHEDLQIVNSFLKPYDLKTDDYKMHRLGKIRRPDKPVRPIVIRFTNLAIVKKILEKEKVGRSFAGRTVVARRFIEFLNEEGSD